MIFYILLSFLGIIIINYPLTGKTYYGFSSLLNAV